MGTNTPDAKPAHSTGDRHADTDFRSILAVSIRRRHDWLVERILFYAERQGYARYLGASKAPWQLSVSGFSASMLEALENLRQLELSPDEDYRQEPTASFMLVEAERHRQRGTSLPIFLGLMKYYRQSYQDLADASELPAAGKAAARVWVDRFFDRAEIAFCNAWVASSGGSHLQAGERNSGCRITDEKNKDIRVADELARKERFLESVLNAIQDGISVLDADLNIIRVNAAMKRIHAQTLPLEGRKCFEAYYGHSQPCENCPTLRTIRSGRLESEEIVLHRGKDSKIYLEVFAFPMKDDQGRLLGVVDYVRNVTARKQVEQTLREHYQQYRRLFESCQLPILLIEPRSGGIVAANSEACRYYGYTREELTRLKITDINRLSKEAVMHEMHRALTQKKNSFNFQHRLSNGDIREVEVFSSPIVFEQQSLLCSFVLDVTERKILDIEKSAGKAVKKAGPAD